MEQIVEMVLAYMLLLLAVPAYCQQTAVPLCPEVPLSELGDPSPFTCTTVISQSWSGSAFTDQCSAGVPPDTIVLNADPLLTTGTCGIFTGTTSVSGNDVTGSLSFTPTENMDGLGIQCRDGLGNLVPSSNFTIEIISDNLIITVEDSPTIYGRVIITLQAPANTTGISNYRVEAILDGNVVTGNMSDDATDLTVDIDGLNLCDESYMYRAEANGGNICPSELTSSSVTLLALGRVGSVRRSGADTVEWDRPSGAPVDCTISYTISVAGGPAGTVTHPAGSTMISLSAISGDLDTCDSNLRITVIAEVPSIGAVASSISDPAFDPTSAFPGPTDIRVVDPPTYNITDDSTVIQITMAPIDIELFPDAYINVSYSGPSCGGSSRVMNDVAQVDIGCLGEANVDFTAVLMDDPDCRSSSTNLPQQSFPRIAEPDFQPTIDSTDDSATVSFPESSDVSVQEDSFNVVGTATRVNGGTTVESDPATYPVSAVFRNLEPNTSYNFAIQIVSQATDGTMIGNFSGNFTTMPSSEPDNTAAIVGGVIGGIVAVVIVLVVVVVYIYYRKNRANKGYVLSAGSGRKPPDERELRERTRSAEAPAEMVDTAPTYADPNMIERQPAPDSQDVYTMVDKAKKAPKPEDQLQTYQTPESILREAAPATGELYTVPETKKGSKKKKEATPAEYTEVDMKKKHQPPSGLMYSELNLPPSGKTPPSKSVEYTDIQPHS